MRQEHGVLGATRVAHDLPVACPAGVPIGERLQGAGCRCRITRTNVLSATDPSSLVSYCLSPDGHLACPVWKDDKHRTWERREQLHEAA